MAPAGILKGMVHLTQCKVQKIGDIVQHVRDHDGPLPVHESFVHTLVMESSLLPFRSDVRMHLLGRREGGLAVAAFNLRALWASPWERHARMRQVSSFKNTTVLQLFQYTFHRSTDLIVRLLAVEHHEALVGTKR
ncbi:hypothetical protein CYMTET_44282 [Cymbomonas tetramitiformis]|uniref:Uncharacterized protein n=1 Tax=Cymbomonas tetramitiformis TaxID=36881 RepID=A0AAE0C0K8_9CHLO|nr:hypothetical protein CYMTET_44282 [Cymbomonas tetramitiformis]